MPTYSLKNILSTFAKANGKRRIIYNLGAIGGISNTSMIAFFIAMPFIEYALIFNPYVFKALGIAQCVVIYIVSLSLIMITIFLITVKLKKSAIQRITPSWKNYFADIDLNLVLSSGITPYSRFFELYEKVAADNKSEEELHHYLADSFKSMKEENKELIEAMIKDNKFN